MVTVCLGMSVHPICVTRLQACCALWFQLPADVNPGSRQMISPTGETWDEFLALSCCPSLGSTPLANDPPDAKAKAMWQYPWNCCLILSRWRCPRGRETRIGWDLGIQSWSSAVGWCACHCECCHVLAFLYGAPVSITILVAFCLFSMCAFE